MPAERAFGAVLNKLTGWVLREQPTTPVTLSVGERPVALSLFPRRDVERVFPGRNGIGYQAVINLQEFSEEVAGGSMVISIQIGDIHEKFTFIIKESCRDAIKLWDEKKRKKLSRVLPLLQCPYCRNYGTFSVTQELLSCECGQVYPRTRYNFNMLSAEARAQFKIDHTENVSSHPYSNQAMETVSRVREAGGLILDCGAGCRFELDDDIICLEVVNYPSTDVCGVGQALPFKDESFECVLSNAVLEHVTDPFKCASEIIRVTKSGGYIFCTVPFLQPEHGYPHHYYNMTQKGLVNLFDSRVTIIRQFIPNWGHPIHMLAWSLSEYHNNLPSEYQDKFRRLTVSELIDVRRNLTSPLVRTLSDDGQRILATSTAILAKK